MFPLKREIMALDVLARLGHLLVELGEQRSQGCEIPAEPFHNRLRWIKIDLEFVGREGFGDCIVGRARRIAYGAGQLFQTDDLEVALDLIRRYTNLLIFNPGSGLELDSILTGMFELMRSVDVDGIRGMKFGYHEINWIQGDQGSSTIASGGQLVGVAEDEDCFVGLDEQVDLLLPYLVNEGGAGGAYRFVCLWGMGGLGKTAIAKAIYHHPKVRGHFCHFTWASAPNDESDGDILNGILNDLLPGWENSAEQEYSTSKEILAYIVEGFGLRVYLRPFVDLLRNEKCLIVLDDIMSPVVLGVLHEALSWEKTTSSRIVLTTRNLNISPSHQSPQCLIYVPRFLNDEQSWELLQKTAIRQYGT